MIWLQCISVPILLVLLVSLNLYIIIREIVGGESSPDNAQVKRDYIIQKLVAYLPFTVTAIYTLVYELSNRRKSVLVFFRDFYTFLGFPLTALHFINLVFHSVKAMFTEKTGFVVFPVVFDEVPFYFTLESSVIILNFFTISMLLCYYNCLARFKAFLPILMFTLLFGGVLLDRFALLDHSRVSTDDWQFIASLTVQILIVDVILIALSYFGNKYTSDGDHAQPDVHFEEDSKNWFGFSNELNSLETAQSQSTNGKAAEKIAKKLFFRDCKEAEKNKESGKCVDYKIDEQIQALKYIYLDDKYHNLQNQI